MQHKQGVVPVQVFREYFGLDWAQFEHHIHAEFEAIREGREFSRIPRAEYDDEPA